MATENRISSGNVSYTLGSLSNFPQKLDTPDTLFTAVNTGQTILAAPISFESRVIPVRDTSLFPSEGLLVIDKEIIFYGQKSTKFFSDLIRGFGGIRSTHEMASEVKASVCADHHNAIRDAILNIQGAVGLDDNAPSNDTMFGRLKALENKYLSLRSIFSSSRPEIQGEDLVTFKDLSLGSPVSWQWEFGDGGVSTERHPTHRYQSSGTGESRFYSVSLTVSDSSGSVSFVKKNDYITVGVPNVLIYTEETDHKLISNEASVTLRDQSSGYISERHWHFGDGTEYKTIDPTESSVTHTYTSIGTFQVSIAIKGPNGVALGPTKPLYIGIT